MLYIFDWDGTLCNSLDTIAAAVVASATEVGLPVLTDAENKSVIGLSLLGALKTLYPDLDDDSAQELVGLYRKHYLAIDLEAPSQLYAGAIDLLERLKTEGHRVAVATGKNRQGLDRVLANLSLADVFDTTRCSDEARSKPHPLMLNQILDELNESPENAMMIGDTDFDLLMGSAAGMDSIGVSYGAHSIERLRAANPKRVIHHLLELLTS